MHVYTHKKPIKKISFWGGGWVVVIYNKLLLKHLWCCVLKLLSELHDFIRVGIVFDKDAPGNEKLVLKRSKLGLGRVMNRDVARASEQIKSCLRYRGARFLYALNTNTALLNISFSLSGSSPKYCSFVSVVKKRVRYHQEREKL